MAAHIESLVGRTIFGSDAQGYRTGRLDYPDELYAVLTEHCDLRTDANVFEIGPGSGQATGALLARGARVVAVEPDPHLATMLTDAGLEFSGHLDVRNEAFESVTLSEAAFDLGVAATSFGWLDRDVALAKILRLLRPGGSWAMWWNVFADQRGDPIMDELHAGLPRPPALTGARHYALDFDQLLKTLTDAGFIEARYFPIDRIVTLTPKALRDLYATFSPLRGLPPAERNARLDRSEGRAVEEAVGGVIQRHLVTPLYIARRPPPE